MKIEIWSDFVCPFCYIGKRQLDLALENFSYRDHIFIQFKCYQLKSRTNEGSKDEAKVTHKRISDQAAEIGLTIHFNEWQHADTFDAHRLVKYAERLGKGTELTGRLLKAYFTEGKNIEDHLVLFSLAEEIGLNRARTEQILETRKYTNAVQEDIDIANEIGVKGVPFFVFDEQYALAGAQPPDVFQEVLETVWHERERDEQIQTQVRKATYCCGDEPCEEDD